MLRLNNDECYCEECKHSKASICISNLCGCCVEADKIRLEHPVFEKNADEEKKEKLDEERETVDAINLWMK